MWNVENALISSFFYTDVFNKVPLLCLKALLG